MITMDSPPSNPKYDMMIKMGIPKEAVLQKMQLENKITKINPNDLQNITLKKTKINEKTKSNDMPYLTELLNRIKLIYNI